MMNYENGQHSAAIKRKQDEFAQKHKKHVSRIIIFSLHTDVLLHDSHVCEYFSGTRQRQKCGT